MQSSPFNGQICSSSLISPSYVPNLDSLANRNQQDVTADIDISQGTNSLVWLKPPVALEKDTKTVWLSSISESDDYVVNVRLRARAGKRAKCFEESTTRLRAIFTVAGWNKDEVGSPDWVKACSYAREGVLYEFGKRNIRTDIIWGH